jgi:hypothetical protein
MNITAFRRKPSLTVCPFTATERRSPVDELSIMGDKVLEGKEEHNRHYHKRRHRKLARSRLRQSHQANATISSHPLHARCFIASNCSSTNKGSFASSC